MYMAPLEQNPKFDLSDNSRWRSYRNGILNHPTVRKAELEATLALLNPQAGERILEIGAGSGYLSKPIASQVKKHGQLVAADINLEGLTKLQQSADDLPLQTYYFSDAPNKQDKFAELYDQPFDAICSLAAFHHFDNRVAETGQRGRKDFLKEALKLLKPGGRLILVDVGGNTPTQRYFDAIDSPKFFAPSGHPHDFHTPDELTELASEVGFTQAQAQIKDTPWVFDSLAQAKTFIHSIHNAQCSEDESYAIADKVLGMAAKNGHFELNWQLMFFSAGKK